MTNSAFAHTRDSDRTIEEILAVTVSLIESGGEGAVRVQQVARLARRTMGAVYHHFGSREGLIEAARVRQFRGHIARDLELLGEHIETSATLEEFLGRVMELILSRHAEDQRDERWTRIDIIGSARRRPNLAAAVAAEGRALNQRLVGLIGRGQERGLIDPAADPLGIAALLQSIDLGFVVNDLHPDRAPTPEVWSRTLAAALQSFLGTGAKQRPAGRRRGAGGSTTRRGPGTRAGRATPARKPRG